MLPFQGARGEALAWVSLTGPLYAAVFATGAAALLARVGCSPTAWAPVAVLFLTSQRIGIMGSSFSDADLALAIVLFAAFVFAIPCEADDSRRATTEAWYAGLLTGIALGIKVSAAIPALIVLAISMLRAAAPSPRSRVRAAIRTGVVYAVSWTVTGGYWYLRNLVKTGNPVYPAAFLIWPGATFPETSLVEYGRRYGIGRAIADALDVYLNWPRAHGVMAVAGLVGLAGWLGWRRSRLTRAQASFGLGALAIASAVLILLPSTPYSAGNAMTFRSGFVHWDSMRYVVLLPILGWSALGVLLGVPRSRSHSSVSLVAWGFRSAAHRACAVAAGALALAAVVAVTHGAKAAATRAAFYEEPLFGAAAAVLDREPAGSRVAVFGDQWIYPAFGDRSHLHPIRLDRDGRPAAAPIGDAMEPGEPTVDPATFRANLSASGVDLVVLVRQPHPGRPYDLPAQHTALERAGGAQLLHRDRAVAIWRLHGVRP
jgi:hypothetical protein